MEYKANYKTHFKKSMLVDIDNTNMIDIYVYGYFVHTISQNQAKQMYNLNDKQIKQILQDG